MRVDYNEEDSRPMTVTASQLAQERMIRESAERALDELKSGDTMNLALAVERRIRFLEDENSKQFQALMKHADGDSFISLSR